MSRLCSCGTPIPNLAMVDGKQRNLQRRKFCLSCSPFGLHNTRNLPLPQSPPTAKFRKWQEKARRERKRLLLDARGGKCCACGYDRCVDALEFHHEDAGTKSFSLSKNNLLRKWPEVLAEAQKCIVLCANCHREVEEKRRIVRGSEDK